MEFVPKKTLCQHIGAWAYCVWLWRSLGPGHHMPRLVSFAVVTEHGTSVSSADEIQPSVWKTLSKVRINDLFGISHLMQTEKLLQVWPPKLLLSCCSNWGASLQCGAICVYLCSLCVKELSKVATGTSEGRTWYQLCQRIICKVVLQETV